MGRKNSRKKNTFYNFTTSVGGQLLNIMMQFVVRTAFINTLGKSYLGINGLFSNILQMLSLAELGVGSAILYKLYAPLANDDRNRINLLMNLYKKIYRVIGGVVFGIGVCLIPFLPNLINDYDRLQTLNINVIFVFLLYLLKSVSSYLFFAYKSAIVKADQKEYMLNLISYIFTFSASILQIILLYIFKDYNVYIIVMVAQVILQNYACAYYAEKKYSYIKESVDGKIDRKEIFALFKDCGALMIYKINSVVVKATDNIVLSVFLGLDAVGIYSNYYIFYTTIRTLYSKVFNSVSHSLGNLHATDNSEHEYKIFEVLMLATAILGGTSFVGIFVVVNSFIEVWLGSDWILGGMFPFVFGLELYTSSFKNILGRYRTTMGLFQQAKFRPVAGMIINLGVSIVLVNYIGIIGVLIGTVASDWLTFLWFDPLIIHKYGFKNKKLVFRFYFKFLKYFFTVLCIAGIDYVICSNFLTGHGWFTVIIHSIICGITTPMAVWLVSFNTAEGQYFINILKKKKKKKR